MLKPLVCYAVNSLCCLMYRENHRQFMRIANEKRKKYKKGVAFHQDVYKTQTEKLFHILLKNQSCEYGKRYNFKHLSTVADFQKQVPLSVYEDYVEYIGRIRKGEKNILTSEEVLILEPSSGSTSASKLIPYTKGLKQEFHKGIRPWIYDLYRNVPGIKWGRSYWSVTPATVRKEIPEEGVPVGFEDDKAYFGSLENKIFDLIFAVPSKVARAKNMKEFYDQTALGLLNCPDLTLISIWNPSFFLLLLEYIEMNSSRLIEEITRRNKRRGAEIQRILDEKTYAELWKNLKVISCWGDAHAYIYKMQLKGIFPEVLIQSKGLLATEGFISFPLVGAQGAVLSVQSHFFEFASVDDQKIYLSSELQAGREYAVILTTSGGLYRYQLKDIVLVTGFAGSVPLIKFIGKQDRVSDLFGEKLNEQFVQNTLESLGIKTDFFMLAPEKDHYVLYIHSPQATKDLEGRLDKAFRANFHYDYCQRLGQLQPVRVFKLTGRQERNYLEECVKRGQRLGDIKPVVLHLQGGWDHVFEGEYL